MKKIFSCLLIIVFMFTTNSPILAFDKSQNENDISSALNIKSAEKASYYIDKEIPKDYDILCKNKLCGVINNENDAIIVPFEYQKIMPLGIDTLKVKKDGKWGVITNNNKSVLKAEFDDVFIKSFDDEVPKDITHSMYFGKRGNNYYFTVAGKDSNDFFDTLFVTNNRISWLRFYSYPKKGIVLLKQGNKYGFLTLNDKNNWIILPQYDDYYFQDQGTTIFKHFGISYSNPDYIIVKKDNKWGIINADGTTSVDFQYDSVVMLDSVIREAICINDVANVIDFVYRHEQINPVEDKIIAKKGNTTYLINKKGDILLEKPTAENLLRYNYDANDTDFLNKLYKENNKVAFVKFYDYPSIGMYITKNNNKLGLKIISDKLKTIPNEYEDFYFQDSNTAIFKQLGVSFSNPERILAKKNGLWGIINSSNEVIVDFQFDETMMFSAIPTAEAQFDKDGVKIIYKNIEFPENKLMIVKKDNLYGVINTDGKYKIPLKYESLDQKEIVKQLAKNKKKKHKNIKDDYNTTDVGNQLVHTGGQLLIYSTMPIRMPLAFILDNLPYFIPVFWPTLLMIYIWKNNM